MGQLTNDKILLAIRITVWIQELISGFVTFMRYGKWLTDINLLLILIRQMAAQVRRALAEVCTVQLLLVFHFISFKLIHSFLNQIKDAT